VGRESQKKEARRRIGEPACAPYDQAPTSEYFFLLPSAFIVRSLTFANFVNFCSNPFASFCSDFFGLSVNPFLRAAAKLK